MRPTTPLRYTIGALAVFAVAFTATGLAGWWTSAANEQAIGEVSRWCERVAGGVLREPVNTLGNLGFVVAGLAMMLRLARDHVDDRPAVNRFIGNTPIAVLYAAATVFLGPGSMVMHGSHTFFGAWIDNVSMVAYILVPWLINLSVLGRWRSSTLFQVYATVLGVYAAGYWLFGSELGIGLDVFGVSIGIWLISELLYRWWSPSLRFLSGFAGFPIAAVFDISPAVMLADPLEHWWIVFFWLPGVLARSPAPSRRRYTPWFWTGVGAFLLAYAIWLTGTADHEWCSPDSFIQAHATWHLLTAFATWAFFLFLRTEGRHALVEATAGAAAREA